MKRWLAPAIVTMAFFVLNVAGRVVAEVFIASDDADTQNLIGICGVAAMAVLAIVAGIYWSIRVPVLRVLADLGAACLVGALLSVLIGPLLVGGNPFGGGFGFVLAELTMFFGVCLIAVFVGYLAATMFGADHRSKGLKRVEHHYGRARR